MCKKIINLFSFFIIIFLLTGNIFSQAQKIVNYKSGNYLLKELDNYLLIKFINNTSGYEKQKIINSFPQNSIISSNNFKSDLFIIQTNSPVQLSTKDKLMIDNNIEYIGSAYSSGGKAIHYLTNEILVKFKKGTTDFQIKNINKLFNTTIISKFDEFDDTYLVKIQSRGEVNQDDAIDISNKMNLISFVDFVQPNFIRSGMLLSPNDSLLPYMWHIKNTSTNIPEGVIGIPGCDANVDSAWNITSGNPNVMIAIIDTGVDTNHVDLRDNLCNRDLWCDAYDNDGKPYDEYYHGTGVSGVAVAIGNNNVGSVGVAYTCKLMPVRVFGPYPTAYTTDLILAKGLNWAWTHGASVLSNSWGGGIPSPLIDLAIRNAVNFGRNGKGCIVLAGSGNSDTSFVLYPSSMPEVISVGGLSPCNQRKSRTSCDNVVNLQDWGASYGEGLSIVAPTTYIGTTTLGGGWCICGNGTSCACPLAAGVVALVISKNVNLSADSVRMIIERSAVKVGNYSYNVNKQNGMWNYEMGYGRIDAKRALDMTTAGPQIIYDMVPPIIVLTPPESKVLSRKIDVIANITDNELVASSNNSPKLYYYTSSHPATSVINSVFENGNYKFTLPLLSDGERMFYYVAAQDTSSNFNVVTYPVGGRGANPPGTVPPAKYLFLQNTEYYDESFISSNVPITISPAHETTIVSTINCSVNKSILDLNCTINITRHDLDDMDVSLISPFGTEYVLTGGVGGENGYNMTNTTFDDEALIDIQDTVNAKPPYTGTFKPIDKLWFFDGENAGGIWKLKVLVNSAGDGGTLNSWSLNLRFSNFQNNINLPAKFELIKNYPNPFNPKTRIVFNVPYHALVTIELYDLSGKLAGVLLNEYREPRYNDYIDFDSGSLNFNDGLGLSSGVYFYSMYADKKFIDSKRMVLIK